MEKRIDLGGEHELYRVTFGEGTVDHPNVRVYHEAPGRIAVQLRGIHHQKNGKQRERYAHARLDANEIDGLIDALQEAKESLRTATPRFGGYGDDGDTIAN